MSDDSSNLDSVGIAKLGDFATKTSQLLTDRLAAQAAQGNGTLSAKDIQTVMASFTLESDATLRGLSESAWSGLQQSFEDAFYYKMRKFPLERLVVGRFVQLLPDRGKDPTPGQTLSRRIIPAFIQALRQMVGPELFDEYEERARNMIDSIRAKEGANMDWETLHERPMAQILVNDILIYIARYFQDIPKRRAWMVSYFDRTMPIAQTHGERAWIFGDMEFHKLMAALYKELAETLFDEAGRQRLEERYDAGSLAMLEQALVGLSHDQRRIMNAG